MMPLECLSRGQIGFINYPPWLENPFSSDSSLVFYLFLVVTLAQRELHGR